MSRGFTFVELTVAIAVLATLTTLGTVNLLAVRNRASISASALTLLTDLRAQQLKAFTGDTQGSGFPSSHGIFFFANGYTLFRGSSYSQDNPTNFTLTLETPLTISTSFQNSQVVFAPGSGEVINYNPNQDTIIVANPVTSESYTLELNGYGVVTQFN